MASGGIKTICAWCHPDDKTPGVSHGICEKHLAQWDRQVEAMEAPMKYKVIRMYQDKNKPNRTILRGLTLEQAQAHCHDPETSSSTATSPSAKRRTKLHGDWFDGYEAE